MAWYWAYGKDMEEAELRRRCPGARKVAKAKLPTAKPEFLEVDGEPVFAVTRDEKQDAWGILYFVDDVELLNVRVGAKGRRLTYRPVWDEENRAYNAYLLEADEGLAPATPSKETLERLVGRATAAGLPEKYVGILGAIKTASAKAEASA